MKRMMDEHTNKRESKGFKSTHKLETTQDARLASVAVLCGGEKVGSGTIIAAGLMITAHHIIGKKEIKDVRILINNELGQNDTTEALLRPDLFLWISESPGTFFPYYILSFKFNILIGEKKPNVDGKLDCLIVAFNTNSQTPHNRMSIPLSEEPIATSIKKHVSLFQ